jgi:hypothetical protein
MIDVNPPDSPSMVGMTEAIGWIEGLDAADNFLYISSSGFRILDIETPETPVFVNSIEPYSSWRFALEGGYAYESEGNQLLIIDIEPPESAHIAYSVDIIEPGELDVSSGYVYIAGYNGSLQIVDVDPPESAYIARIVEIPGESDFVSADSGCACVGQYDPGKIYIIDINPPESAYLAKTIGAQGCLEALHSQGNYVYFTNSDYSWPIFKLAVIDASQPESAYIQKAVDLLGGFYPPDGLTVRNGYAYIVGGGAMVIYDVDPIATTYFLSLTLLRGGYWMDIIVNNNFAYIDGGYGAGLRIVELW